MRNNILFNFDHDDLNLEECGLRSASTKEKEYKLGQKQIQFRRAFRGRPAQRC